MRSEFPGPLGPFAPLSPQVRAASLEATLARAPGPDPGSDPLWVFAYGSLIWQPGFEPHRVEPAFLSGYHRSLCMWTIRARGRPERPGLGLALAPGGSCHGLALAIPDAVRRRVLLALWEREMYTGIYRPQWVSLEVGEDRIAAIAFVIERDHPQYAGAIPQEAQAHLIARAEGEQGSCYEYLRNTVEALCAHAISDVRLDGLLASTECVRAQGNVE